MENVEIYKIKVIDRRFGFDNDITGRCLDELFLKTIHKDENAHKNVCESFVVDATKIDPKPDWYMAAGMFLAA